MYPAVAKPRRCDSGAGLPLRSPSNFSSSNAANEKPNPPPITAATRIGSLKSMSTIWVPGSNYLYKSTQISTPTPINPEAIMYRRTMPLIWPNRVRRKEWHEFRLTQAVHPRDQAVSPRSCHVLLLASGLHRLGDSAHSQALVPLSSWRTIVRESPFRPQGRSIRLPPSQGCDLQARSVVRDSCSYFQYRHSGTNRLFIDFHVAISLA